MRKIHSYSLLFFLIFIVAPCSGDTTSIIKNKQFIGRDDNGKVDSICTAFTKMLSNYQQKSTQYKKHIFESVCTKYNTADIDFFQNSGYKFMCGSENELVVIGNTIQSLICTDKPVQVKGLQVDSLFDFFRYYIHASLDDMYFNDYISPLSYGFTQKCLYQFIQRLSQQDSISDNDIYNLLIFTYYVAAYAHDELTFREIVHFSLEKLILNRELIIDKRHTLAHGLFKISAFQGDYHLPNEILKFLLSEPIEDNCSFPVCNVSIEGLYLCSKEPEATARNTQTRFDEDYKFYKGFEKYNLHELFLAFRYLLIAESDYRQYQYDNQADYVTWLNHARKFLSLANKRHGLDFEQQCILIYLQGKESEMSGNCYKALEYYTQAMQMISKLDYSTVWNDYVEDIAEHVSSTILQMKLPKLYIRLNYSYIKMGDKTDEYLGKVSWTLQQKGYYKDAYLIAKALYDSGYIHNNLSFYTIGLINDLAKYSGDKNEALKYRYIHDLLNSYGDIEQMSYQNSYYIEKQRRFLTDFVRLGESVYNERLKLTALNGQIKEASDSLIKKRKEIGTLEDLNKLLEKEKTRAQDAEKREREARISAENRTQQFIVALIASTILLFSIVILSVRINKQKKIADRQKENAIEQKSRAESSEAREKLLRRTMYQLGHLGPQCINNLVTSLEKEIVADKDKIMSRLDSLSELLRKFYDYSKMNFITYRDEYDLTCAYVDIAFERQGQTILPSDLIKSNYQDVPDTKMPTFVAFNAVQNAFKHGKIANYNTTKTEVLLNVHLDNCNNSWNMRIENKKLSKKVNTKVGGGLNFIEEALKYWNGDQKNKNSSIEETEEMFSLNYNFISKQDEL